jgi:protein phosphatase
MTLPTLSAAAGSDPGQAYRLNQDCVLALLRPPEEASTAGLFVVADGMGGHQAGEVASQLAVESVREQLAWLLEPSGSQPSAAAEALPEPEDDPATQLARQLESAVRGANRQIFSYARENPAQAGNLGTTLTGLLVADGRAAIANVGDSRTYIWRDGELFQITDDHSYIGHLVREGQLEPEALYTHPRRNVITRSLGNSEHVVVDTWILEVEPGDRFLLCSDGLWEMVQGNDALADLVADAPTPANTVAALIEAANAAGGRDNIGAVVVFVNGA